MLVRPRRSTGAILLVALASLLVGPSAADAHTNLASSNPGANAATDGVPDQVRMRFRQSPQPDERTTVVVLTPSGEDLARGPAVADARGVAQPLAASQEKGWFRVRYRVVFEDGHTGEGAFRFQVADRAAPPPSRRGPLLMVGGAAAAFFLYAGLVYAGGRRRASLTGTAPAEPTSSRPGR